MDKPIIVFVQPHLKYGGAERQTVLVANRIVQLGIECHVVLHEAKGGLLGELSPEVDLHDLGLESHIATPLVARRLAQELAWIDAGYVIVKLWSSILACALIERRSHHIFNYCEDLDPKDHADYIAFGKIKQKIIGAIFRRRHRLTANTNRVAKSMSKIYRLSRVPDVISSTVDPDAVASRASDTVDSWTDAARKNVLSVGSLIHRKGLMESLHAMGGSGIPIVWGICGEGPLAGELVAQAKKYPTLKLRLLGGHPNPYPYMAAADCLLHNAVSEAFGIVILESLAVGTPVVAARAIGPTEMQEKLGRRDQILRLYDNGNAYALVEALTETLKSEVPRNAEGFRNYILPYGLEASVKLWIDRAMEAVQ